MRTSRWFRLGVSAYSGGLSGSLSITRAETRRQAVAGKGMPLARSEGAGGPISFPRSRHRQGPPSALPLDLPGQARLNGVAKHRSISVSLARSDIMVRSLKIGAAAAVLLASAFAPTLAACGDNGGPGYRNQSGRCVGWEALGRQCGNPPSTHCKPENVATGPDDAAGGATIRSLMDRSHAAKTPANYHWSRGHTAEEFRCDFQ